MLTDKRLKRHAALTAVVAAATALSACSLPRSAPLASEIRNGGARGNIPVLPLSAAAVADSDVAVIRGFPGTLRAVPEIDPTLLGVGDRVSATIWEGGGTGLTVAVMPGGQAVLTNLVIGADGILHLPFAGQVVAQGRTVAAVREDIAAALKRKLYRPQVDLQIVDQPGRIVTIQGDVDRAGSYPLKLGMTRIGALLAIAGVRAENADLVDVEVHRGGRIAALRLSDIYEDPRQDIALMASDNVILRRAADRVIVLGAAGVQSRIPIINRRFSLLDAIAQARGLDDERADPNGVFLFRGTSSGTMARPVIYQLDLRDPVALILAGQFRVHDGDAIYLTNAPFTQTRKVLNALAGSLSFARSAEVVVP